MLKFKNRKEKVNLKKVLVYGLDGSGKSTFASKYCKDNNLTPIVLDIDDTNYCDDPIVDLDLRNDIKTYDNIITTIKEIKKSEDFDTIILDGVTSLLELLVSRANGLKKYSDRAERWNDILRALLNSGKNIIFIGQADMEVIYTEEHQSSKAVIKVNSLVNEKYECFVTEEGEFSHRVKKYRGIPENAELTGEEDKHLQELLKTFCLEVKESGKPCRKGVLLNHIKIQHKEGRISKKECMDLNNLVKSLPNGEINHD